MARGFRIGIRGSTSTVIEVGNQNIATNQYQGTQGAWATASITLDADSTYLVTAVLAQTSSDGYSGNSQMNGGSWSFSSPPVLDESIISTSGGYYSSRDIGSHSGRLRLRNNSEQRLIKTGAATTVSRNAACTGYGGGIMVTLYAVKISI